MCGGWCRFSLLYCTAPGFLKGILHCKILDWEIWVQALARVILLCSWAWQQSCSASLWPRADIDVRHCLHTPWKVLEKSPCILEKLLKMWNLNLRLKMCLNFLPPPIINLHLRKKCMNFAGLPLKSSWKESYDCICINYIKFKAHMSIWNSNKSMCYVLHQGIRNLLLLCQVKYGIFMRVNVTLLTYNVHVTLVMSSLCIQFWCSFVGTADGTSTIQGCRSSGCSLWCGNEQLDFANT